MLRIFLSAFVLVAVTVAVHSTGLAALLRIVRTWYPQPPTNIWAITRLLILVSWFLTLFHLLEIAIWGVFYLRQGCLPDAEAAFYFSGVTYAAIGYGDLVLSKPWRMLGPIEGLTGVIMCGLSAGFFVAVVNRIYQTTLIKSPKGSTTGTT